CHRLHARFELHLVDRLSRDEREDPVRAGLDLDRGRELVALDLGDDAGEPVALARLRDRLLGPLRSEEPRHLGGGDFALSALRARRAELALALPAPERLDPHAEGRRRLTDPVGIRHGAHHTQDSLAMANRNPGGVSYTAKRTWRMSPSATL